MTQQVNGASSGEDRATHEQSPQAVSAVPVGIPSASLCDTLQYQVDRAFAMAAEAKLTGHDWAKRWASALTEIAVHTDKARCMVEDLANAVEFYSGRYAERCGQLAIAQGELARLTSGRAGDLIEIILYAELEAREAGHGYASREWASYIAQAIEARRADPTDAALLQQICDGMEAVVAPLPGELSEGDEA